MHICLHTVCHSMQSHYLSTDTIEDITMVITVELIDAWPISTVSKSETTQIVKSMKQITIHIMNCVLEA